MSIQRQPSLRIQWLLLIWCAAMVAGWFLYGPHIIDDSFITFRYARNLGTGHGLVFQDGERVLGFSAPLWTLILSMAEFLGLSIPIAAVGLSYGSYAALALLVFRIGCATNRRTSSFLTIAFLTISVFFYILLASGMETMLYTAVTTGLLLSVVTRRWRHVGALAGLAMFTRYDGLITVIVSLVFTLWLGGWRTALKQALIAAAIYLPWFLFSWGYYGSPIPQTIIAKKAVHYVDWSLLFKTYIPIYLSFQPLWALWFAAATWGGVTLARRDRAFAILPAWVLAFGGTFLAAKTAVPAFIWYLAPLYPIMFFLGVVGLEELSAKLARWNIARLLIPALLLLYHGYFFLQKARTEGSSVIAREEAYRQNAQVLNQFVKPGYKILVGEVGTLGWYVRDATIIDGYGLITPEVSTIRRENRAWMLQRGIPLHDHTDGTPEATLEMVRRFSPDVITARDFYLCLSEGAMRDPLIKDHYVRLTAPESNILSQATLVKKSLLPDLKGLQTKPIE
ncbi:MAG: hypothetical protein ABI579_00110 [Candidatus Sumerlaeota bacterium]